MENQIHQNTPPIQPPIYIPIPSSYHWLKNLLLVLLGFIIIAGSLLFGIQIGRKQVKTPEQQPIKVQPTDLLTPIATNTLVPTMNPSPLFTPTPTTNPALSPIPNIMIYQDPDKKYSFNYSSEYKVISEVPVLFDGTMLDQVKNNCKGPVLQNVSDPHILIVMEIVPANSDGAFCWSNGTFTQDNKWIGGGSDVWKGSYFIMKEVQASSKYRGFIGLANKETYILKGEDGLKQILATFKFTE